MKRGRMGGGLAALLQYGKALFNTIKFKLTVAVGGGGISVVSKTGITTLNDAGGAGVPPVVYNPTTNAAEFGTVGVTGSLRLLTTNAILYGPSGNFNVNCSDVLVRIATTGGGLIDIESAGHLNSTGWLLAKGGYTHYELNGSGGNSVIGKRYIQNAITGETLSAVIDIIGSNIYICEEIVANGSSGRFRNINNADGELIEVYFSAATTAGQYAVFDPVNAGQHISQAADIPTRRLGLVVDTIGGSGLATVLIQKG